MKMERKWGGTMEEKTEENEKKRTKMESSKLNICRSGKIKVKAMRER
jgi:hypothetical protein